VGERLSDEMGPIGPLSTRSGGPELLIGGYVPAGGRRISQWGDGYMGAGGGGPEGRVEMWEQNKKVWEEIGRRGAARRVGGGLFCLGTQCPGPGFSLHRC